MELDVLQVLTLDRRLVNTKPLWLHFWGINGCFVERYTAYQYYRNKGWVPKSGLKFGVDFLLYKEGPPFYHSTYAVIVRLIEHTEPSLNCKFRVILQPSSNWTHLEKGDCPRPSEWSSREGAHSLLCGETSIPLSRGAQAANLCG